MKDTIEMAREAGIIDFRDAYSEEHVQAVLEDLKAFEALVRADERKNMQEESEADNVIIEYYEKTIKRLQEELKAKENT